MKLFFSWLKKPTFLLVATIAFAETCLVTPVKPGGHLEHWRPGRSGRSGSKLFPLCRTLDPVPETNMSNEKNRKVGWVL